MQFGGEKFFVLATCPLTLKSCKLEHDAEKYCPVIHGSSSMSLSLSLYISLSLAQFGHSHSLDKAVGTVSFFVFTSTWEFCYVAFCAATAGVSRWPMYLRATVNAAQRVASEITTRCQSQRSKQNTISETNPLNEESSHRASLLGFLRQHAPSCPLLLQEIANAAQQGTANCRNIA